METNKNNLYLDVLNTAQCISDLGPTFVHNLKVTEKKRLYTLIIEAFRSFSAFSRLIKEHYLVQSSAVLRMFVEQTMKISILVEHPALYDIYSEHCQLREQILDISKVERKQKIIEHFNLNKSESAFSYLDYGWIKTINNETYGYHEMLQLAFSKEGSILQWIDRLDQFIHQNIESLSLSESGFSLFEQDHIYFSCLMFEKFFVAFHNLTKKEFVVNGIKLFEDKFWPLYEKIIKPCDRVN